MGWTRKVNPIIGRITFYAKHQSTEQTSQTEREDDRASHSVLDE